MKIVKWILWATAALSLVGCDDTEEPLPAFCKASGGATECKDADQCTVDSCNESARKCEFKIAVDTVCDDGDACTTGEKCDATAACKNGTAVKPDDKNPCTDNLCNSKTGVSFPPNSAPCDDSDACTEKDICKDGECKSGPKKDCSDDNPCTEDDKCNASSGKCAHEAKDGTCTDSDACTTGDKCIAGKCEGSPLDTDDKNPCTKDACDPKTGATHTVQVDAPCDDDNACTEADKCDALGKCKPGSAVKKDDGNPCTKDACDPKLGVTNEAIVDGPCDDGDKCTEADKCDAQGACKAGGPAKVDDGNPCTTDSCDKAKGVLNEANANPCEDGSACTIGDKCADKVCTPGQLLDCPDKDGDSCTAEACDPKIGCVVGKAKDGTKCTDNNKCTDVDECLAGKCEGGAQVKCTDTKACQEALCDPKFGCTWKPVTDGAKCTDDDACTDKDACKGGTCLPGPTLKCVDTNGCTTDACDAKSGCTYTPNNDPCDDKNLCTEGDICKSGACSPGALKACDDKQACTTDECNPKTGECGSFNSTDGSPCDDNDKCTAESACLTGKCSGASPVTCKDDGNPCTKDACDKLKGCAYPSAEGAPCDADGNVCTKVDVCKDSKCVVGAVISCDDKNPCTDDSCDKVKGCLNLFNVADCDDGLLCTVGDKCKDGKCAVSTPKNCSDGNTCTVDQCDAAKGCLNPVELDGSVCDDGSACSTGDTCLAGACKSGGAALWVKKAGTALQDSYFALTVGQDGTLVAVGRSYTGNGTYAPVFVGTNPENVQKFNATGTNTGPTASLRAVTAAGSGVYVAVGQANPKSEVGVLKCYAMQVNASGNVDWDSDCFASDSPSSPAAGVAARPAGGVVVVGYEFTCAGGPCRTRGFVSELDASGKATGLKKTYEATSPFTSASYHRVAIADADGYWVSGTFDDGKNQVPIVARIQANGSVLFQTVLEMVETGGQADVNSLIADKGGATIFGTGNYGPYGGTDGWMARVDNSGKVIMKSHLGSPGQDGFSDAIAAPGGGYYVAGYWTVAGAAIDTQQGLVGRVSDTGAMVWQRTFSDKPSTWRGIGLTKNGFLALAGYTHVQTAGDADTLLATCDLYGNCDCASSGTCLTKNPSACDDKNVCTLDSCDAGQCKSAIGNEGLTCDTNKTCQKGKCL